MYYVLITHNVQDVVHSTHVYVCMVNAVKSC